MNMHKNPAITASAGNRKIRLFHAFKRTNSTPRMNVAPQIINGSQYTRNAKKKLGK
jgi:hypothetical protein